MKKFLSTLLAFGYIFCSSPAYPEKQTVSITQESKLERVVNNIIDYHEKKTGVSYSSKRPRLLFDENMDYDEVARYDVEDENIYLHPRFKDLDLSSFDILENVSGNAIFLREVLSHELGHFLTDLYINKFAPDSWLARFYEKNFEGSIEDTDVYIVVEGIGEYFGRIFNEGGAVFATERWDDKHPIEDFNSGNFNTWLFYMGGRDLVHPILDISAHDGLIWLLNNELKITPPDLSEVPKYKNKGIKELWMINLEKKLKESGREIKVKHIKDYLRLQGAGAGVSLVSDILEHELKDMADGIESGRFPLFLFDEYDKYSHEYSARAALRDPEFKKGAPWARKYLKSALDNRDHISRLDTDYREDSDQISSIKDKYILFLIKRHVDYFNKKENWKQIVNLFNPQGKEEGGFIIDDNGKNRLVEISNKETGWDSDQMQTYDLTPSEHYAHYTGMFHTHPQYKNKPKAEYAGPYGESRIYTSDRSTSDMLVHIILSQRHTFLMDCVISDIGDNKYNVDLYFRDVENVNGKAVKDKKVTVLDLGIFDLIGIE